MAEQKVAEGKVCRIGTRKSALAMWQANYVADTLRKLHADLNVEVIGVATMGDKDQIKPLAEFDAKGLFTKELDVAMLNNEIDLGVHCLKDLPTQLPPGLAVAAILERGDVEDVVVMHEKHKGKTLSDLPKGSIIGTSALRRAAFLHRLHPGLVDKNIRGNLNTRLAKLDKGDYDAIILAQIGLKRLEFGHRISQVLDPDVYGYAIGQGALALVTREGDAVWDKVAKSMHHPPTHQACLAERAMLRTLQGGCKVPIAVNTKIDKGKMSVWGAVFSLDGQQKVEHTEVVELKDDSPDDVPLGCGNKLGKKLLDLGAEKILEGIDRT